MKRKRDRGFICFIGDETFVPVPELPDYFQIWEEVKGETRKPCFITCWISKQTAFPSQGIWDLGFGPWVPMTTEKSIRKKIFPMGPLQLSIFEGFSTTPFIHGSGRNVAIFTCNARISNNI